MTPSPADLARAEKIAKNVASLLNYVPRLADTNYAAVIQELSAALAEVSAEAYQDAISKCAVDAASYDKGFAAGAEAMRERAAKVCRNYPASMQKECADIGARIEMDIRALAILATERKNG